MGIEIWAALDLAVGDGLTFCVFFYFSMLCEQVLIIENWIACLELGPLTIISFNWNV